MKHLSGDGTRAYLELSRRNLEALLAKLDDPASLDVWASAEAAGR